MKLIINAETRLEGAAEIWLGASQPEQRERVTLRGCQFYPEAYVVTDRPGSNCFRTEREYVSAKGGLEMVLLYMVYRDDGTLPVEVINLY